MIKFLCLFKKSSIFFSWNDISAQSNEKTFNTSAPFGHKKGSKLLEEIQFAEVAL